MADSIVGQNPAALSATPRAISGNAVSKILPVVKKSQLNGTEVRNTAFISCNLKHMDLRGCNISLSTLYDCKLSNCTVSECDLVNTALHETKFAKSSMENCKVTTSPLALRILCPELRKLIFERCIRSPDNTSPVLLVALRGNPELYYEALECFYRLNTFRLKLANLSDYRGVSKKAAENIRKLDLDFRQINRPLLVTLPEPFLNCLKVERFRMAGLTQDELYSWAKYVVKAFPNLRVIQLAIPMSYVQGTNPRAVQLRAGVDVLSQNLRIEGRIFRVTTSSWEIWTWEAARGQTFNWHLYSPQEQDGTER